MWDEYSWINRGALKVYTAQSSIDAHIVKDLLELHEMEAWVEGGYLQGGIGELPPMGLISVSVVEEDYDRALSLVCEYEENEIDKFW